jgi:hypothetical protein
MNEKAERSRIRRWSGARALPASVVGVSVLVVVGATTFSCCRTTLARKLAVEDYHAMIVGACRLRMRIARDAEVTQDHGGVAIVEHPHTRHSARIRLDSMSSSGRAVGGQVPRTLSPENVLWATERATEPGEGNNDEGQAFLDGVLVTRGCPMRVSCHASGQSPGWCVPYLATVELSEGARGAEGAGTAY